MKEIQKYLQKYILYFMFGLTLFSTLLSLYFSEILHFPPCILCWYQRIVMYPLVVILAIGIYLKDKKLPYYVLPLSTIGLIIAIYHNLLYYNILPESATPCLIGVSCTTKYIELFGFITIPFLSLIAFLIITIGMIVYARTGTKVQRYKGVEKK